MENKNAPQMQFNLFWLLVRATVLTKPRLAVLSEKYTLTPPQIFTLCTLEPGRAVPMHAVSNGLHCDASNVTGIVDRLVIAGLVERKELPQDRRVKALMLTEKGIHMRQELLKAMAAAQLPGAGFLTNTEKASLQKLLTKLLAQ